MTHKKRRTSTHRTSNNAVFPSPPPLLKLSHNTMALVGDFITPPDLLSLYRTCKDIHTFLAQDASKIIWQAARANAESIPPCPKWLTKPQFIALLFDKHCSKCLAMDECSKEPIWPFYVRYCSACKAASTTTTSPLQDFPPGDYLVRFESIIPELFPNLLDVAETDSEPTETRIYHLPDICNVQKKIVAAVYWSAPSAFTCEDRARMMGLVAILEEKRLDTQACLQFAEQCREWKEDWNQRQASLHKAIKTQRRNDILDKLKDLDYYDVVHRLGRRYQGFSDGIRDLVDQARHLTEHEWTTIAPRVIQFAEYRRKLESRVDYVRVALYRLKDLEKALDSYHVEWQGGEDSFPTVLDLLDVRDAASLLSLPTSAILLTDLYVDRVPIYVTQWKKDRQETLLSLLPGLLPPSASTASPSPVTTRSMRPKAPPFAHPAALFWCSACRTVIHATVAMTHVCCYGKAGSDHGQILTKLYGNSDGIYSRPIVAGNQLFQKTFLAFCRGVLPWSCTNLHGAVDVVHSILAAGGDLQLDDLLKGPRTENFRVACKICSQAGTCILAMSWRRAVAHAFDMHDGTDVSWAGVCSAVEAKVKHVEYRSGTLTTAAAEVSARWCCSRCPWPRSRVAYSWPQLNTHFLTDHPFALMTNEEYRQSQDLPPPLPPAVLLIDTTSEDIGVKDQDRGVYVAARMKIAKDAWTSILDDANQISQPYGCTLC